MANISFAAPKNIAITAICIIGIVNVTQMINLIFSPMAKNLGTAYPLYFTLSAIISLACIAGLWCLKKWAALAYVAILICNQIVLVTMGLWEFTAVLLPIVIITILFKNLNKMT